MAEEDTPYSPFQPPIDYDTSKIFTENPICADFKIERTSRPALLPQHIQFIQPQQQCMRRGIRFDSLLRETTELTMDTPTQLAF